MLIIHFTLHSYFENVLLVKTGLGEKIRKKEAE